MARFANSKRIKRPILKKGNKVYLIRQKEYIKTIRPSYKLNYKKLSLFKILQKLLLVSYELALPHGMKIYPVFHISLLEPVAGSTVPDNAFEIQPDDTQEYEIEKIIKHRGQDNILEYLIK